MAKSKQALPRILVIEDDEAWREQLAMMYCRIVRQVEEVKRSGKVPRSCKNCVYATSCIDIEPNEIATTKYRDELVQTAGNAEVAQDKLHVSQADMKAKKRNFDILSLDQNLNGSQRGEDLLTLATAGDRRVAVIAITGFRNDRSLQRSMDDYDNLWNFRRRIEQKANGACELFEKASQLQDAVGLVREAIDVVFEDNPAIRGQASEVLLKLLTSFRDSDRYKIISKGLIRDQVRRIEASLTLGDLRRLVERTDDPTPLSKKDRLCLHFVVPDTQLPTDMKAWACVSVGTDGKLRLAGIKAEDFNNFKAWENRFHDDINDGFDLAKQLVTRLAILSQDPSVSMYCSVDKEGRSDNPPEDLHLIPTSRNMPLLLTRLVVQRMLSDIKANLPPVTDETTSVDCREIIESIREGVSVAGLKRDKNGRWVNNPFPEAFGNDVRPRSNYNLGEKGDIGQTGDPVTLKELRPFLGQLIGTKDVVVEQKYKLIRLRLPAMVYFHRQSSIHKESRSVTVVRGEIDD